MAIAKILFLSTSEFAIPTLESLINNKSLEVTALVTKSEKRAYKMKKTLNPISKFAAQHNLKVYKFKSINSSEAITTLKSLNVDCVLLISFGQILSSKFLNSFPTAINIHASLLPKLRGAAPIHRAIMNGDTMTGVCMQYIEKELDSGAVIGQKKQEIYSDMTYIELHDKLKILSKQLVDELLTKAIKKEIKPIKQNKNLVTYAKSIKKEEGFIKFDTSSDRLYNIYRGLHKWPETFFKRKSKIIKITQMKLSSMKATKPGIILKINKEHITVSCKEGSVDLFRLKPESKKDMSALEFTNGFKIKVGEKIND